MKNQGAPRRHGVTENNKRRMAFMTIPTVTLEHQSNSPWVSLCLCVSVVSFLFFLAGCNHAPAGEVLTPKATGTALVESSGGKQVADVGNNLPQPVVVQVNGADGNAVTGALVSFHGDGLTFTPAQALSDSSGQVSVVVQVGTEPRNYTLVAETLKPDRSRATLELRETALGYEQRVGKEVNDKYCVRCHDNESTAQRVSNFDNLTPAPHNFSDGTFLNNLKDADLIGITARGGPALGKAASMPPFAGTLDDKQIRAVIAYMRAVADPPYQTSGVKYGK